MNEYDSKAFMKINNLSYESNIRDSKAFDSNYSETGTWLDSKFNVNRSGDQKIGIQDEQQNIQVDESVPSLFNKNYSGKKLINDYILMGKVKNISFPNDKKQGRRYSNSKKRYFALDIFILNIQIFFK